MSTTKDYRIYPIIFMSFLRVAVSFTLELAIPLYFVGINLNPTIIGIITSGTSMIYLFSPVLLKNIPKKIGIKNSLLISVSGSLIIQIIFQFSLAPWLVYGLLITEGFLIGLFWPVLITSLSILSRSEKVCADESEQDKLINNYNVAWNSGAIFSYLIGTILLFIIELVELVFTLTLIYSIFLLVFTVSFQDPETKESKKEPMITNALKTNCKREKVSFPLFLPLYVIAFYGFLIGSLILLYPLKSEVLNFAVFTTYLLNFFRMTAQTISISKLSTLSIKKLKKLFYFSLPAMLIIFLSLDLFNNIFIFSALFISFGFFGSILYMYSFRLTIYKNIVEDSSKYSSYFETSSGIGFFMSPIIGGFLADINLNFAFYFTAILTLVIIIISLLIRKTVKFE
ncbi:MAG: MFS transporter [Promethearchaeota archaeon]|nr:MAG: MFS transporter [Candidatus Lokiarchaeota archaeon]